MSCKGAWQCNHHANMSANVGKDKSNDGKGETNPPSGRKSKSKGHDGPDGDVPDGSASASLFQVTSPGPQVKVQPSSGARKRATLRLLVQGPPRLPRLHFRRLSGCAIASWRQQWQSIAWLTRTARGTQCHQKPSFQHGMLIMYTPCQGERKPHYAVLLKDRGVFTSA